MTEYTEYEKFISSSAWLSAILYPVPAIILFCLLNHFDATREYVVVALLVYLIAAIAHLLTYGFQAVCAQIKHSTDYVVKQRAGVKSK